MLNFQNDATSNNDESSKKTENSSVRQPKSSTPKSNTTKQPEIIRSPRKLNATSNRTNECSTGESARQKVICRSTNINRKFKRVNNKIEFYFQSDLSRDKEESLEGNGNGSDRQRSDNVPKPRGQRTLKAWFDLACSQKDRNDELPTLPKRQTIQKPTLPSQPPPPDTTSPAKNVNQATAVAQKVAQNHDDDDNTNEAVIVSSDSPNVITQ